MSEEHISQAIMAICTAVTTCVGTYFAFRGKVEELRVVTKKVDNAVNNIHHFRKDADGNILPDEDGNPVKMTLADLVKATHDDVIVLRTDVAEAKQIGMENSEKLVEHSSLIEKCKHLLEKPDKGPDTE